MSAIIATKFDRRYNLTTVTLTDEGTNRSVTQWQVPKTQIPKAIRWLTAELAAVVRG